MWLLVSTLCLVAAPGVAECKSEARAYADRLECVQMVKPTRAYLEAQSAEVGATTVYLFAGCKSGHVI